MADVTDLLDREQAHLTGLDDVDYLRRLPAYVALLRGQRDLREPLRTSEMAARQAQQRFAQREEALIERTVSARRRLVELAPAADDHDVPEPDDWGSHDHAAWRFTLAHFDRLAEQNFQIVYPKIAGDTLEEGPVPELANIVRGKIRELQYGEPSALGDQDNERPDLDELAYELANVIEEHAHSVREFELASRTLPGVALARIEHFASNLNPEPVLIDPTEDFADRLNKSLLGLWGIERPVQQAVAGGHLDDYEQRRLARVVEYLRTAVELVNASLVQQLATDELRRERQWWRKAGRWFASTVGETVVAIVVTALVAFLSGYLIGQRGTDEPSPPPSTTTTTTKATTTR